MSLAPPAAERGLGGRASAEEIVWLGLWPATLLLIGCVLWLAPPLSDLYPEPTYQFYPLFLPAVKPEPLEATRVLIALVIPFALAGLALLGSAAPLRRRFEPAVIVLQLAGVAFVAWAVLEQDSGPLPFVRPDYFQPFLLSAPVLVAGTVLGALLTGLALTGARPFDRLDRPQLPSLRASRGALAAAVVLTVLWLAPAVLTDELVAGSGLIPSGHVFVQAEDYFAVANGLTPTVDYVSQYANLLPLALAPVLEAFNLSLTSFSLLMVALSLVALLALYGVFHEVTRRPLAALALFVPFLALSLFPWTDEGLNREFNGNYFGVLPGRYLGPFVVAWLCALAIRRGRLPMWSLFFAAGLTAINNAEFGVPCLIALTVALLLGADPAKPVGARVRALLGQAAIGLAGAVALASVVILVRSGELPDPALLTYYAGVFARQGFGLEPMPTLGLHIAMYLSYVAALLVAVVRYRSAGADRPTTAMLAYVGVFGLLTSEYFAGRSLPWQLFLLFPVWGFTLALLAWITVGHLRSVGGKRGPWRRTIIPSLAAMAGFGVMVAAITTFPAPWRQVERLSQDGQPPGGLQQAQDFVERETAPAEPIVLLGTGADHRVAERSGVANVSPWNSVVSVFSDREFTRALDALDAARGTKVFVPFAPADVPAFDSPALEGSSIDAQPSLTETLRARGFERVATDHALELWQSGEG